MNLDGRTILITGSTDGVGRQVALTLAAAGANVLVHGRNAQRGQLVLDAIRTTGNGPRTVLCRRLLLADAGARARRRNPSRSRPARRPDQQCRDRRRSGGRQRRTSGDGHELRFAVNYLAGFLLTRLLLPLVLASAPGAHRQVSLGRPVPDRFDDVMLTRGYERRRAYARASSRRSCSRSIWRRSSPERASPSTCLHPATYMDTTMVREPERHAR